MGRPAAAATIALIRLYQLTLSPAFAALGVRCRHEPSCSAYAKEAVRRHGAWAGAWMAAARLSRCHPFGSHGFDPAPSLPPSAARWWRPWGYGDWAWRARPAPTADETRDEPC